MSMTLPGLKLMKNIMTRTRRMSSTSHNQPPGMTSGRRRFLLEGEFGSRGACMDHPQGAQYYSGRECVRVLSIFIRIANGRKGDYLAGGTVMGRIRVVM